MKKLEEQGGVESFRNPTDRRKRIYKHSKIGEGREKEFINELNNQLNDLLTGDQIGEIKENLSEDVLDALEDISEYVREVNVGNYSIKGGGNQSFGCCLVFRSKR